MSASSDVMGLNLHCFPVRPGASALPDNCRFRLLQEDTVWPGSLPSQRPCRTDSAGQRAASEFRVSRIPFSAGSRNDINAGFRKGWRIFAGPLMLNSAVYLIREP
jgi:hypothetical protein